MSIKLYTWLSEMGNMPDILEMKDKAKGFLYLSKTREGGGGGG